MKKKTFMIIDDDEDDRFFFREALEEMRPSTVYLEATDGVAALEFLRKAEQLPDFIFLDMNMPRMDGRECLKELKRDEKLRDIMVIMYSTYFSEQSIREFQQLGAATYFKKPINTNDLSEEILNALRRSMHTS